MAGFILGQKQTQTQIFTESGVMMPVTRITTASCYLVDVKWSAQNGYMSIKLGFGPTKKITKPIEGQLKKAGIKTPLRFLREIRVRHLDKQFEMVEETGKTGIKIGEKVFMVGQEVGPEIFGIGDIIDVSGVSKGKGFQGVVKRHGFHGGPKTHGQSDRERAPGSIGSATTPGRVLKGLRMAGRMGGERVTVQNLEVLGIEDQTLIVKGLVPGGKNALIEVKTHGL